MADSSALLQIIISEEITPLRVLKQDFGVQIAVHEAVQSELNWRVQKSFPGKLAILKKAFSTNTIEVLDRALLDANDYKAATAVIEQIDNLGQQFSLRVDRGEA